MTPEDKARLAATQSDEELEALLQEFFEAGKITEEEALALWDEFDPRLRQDKVASLINPEGGVGTEAYGPALAPDPIDPLDQYLSDPKDKAWVLAAISVEDLAGRLGYLIGQGIIPDVATAGAIFNRILGKTADRTALNTAEANLVSYPDSPTYQAAVATAQKAYKAAQAAKDQQSTMSILAGIAARDKTQAKIAGGLARQAAITGTMSAQAVEDFLKSQGLWTVEDENAKKRGIGAQASAGAQQARITYEAGKLGLDDLESYLKGLGEWTLTDERAKQNALEQSALAAEKGVLEAPIAQANKDVYLPGLKTYLQQAVQSGTITQGQADSQYSLESSYIDKGYNLQDLPNYASLKGLGWVQTKEQKMAGEAQSLVDIINERNRAQEANKGLARKEMFEQSEQAGFDRLIDEYRRRTAFQAREAERPAIPALPDVAEEFLGTIGSPRFREFIRSKLGDIAAQTAGARAEWWQRKQPIQPMAEPSAIPVPTFESLLGGARADVRERGDILRSAQLGASTGAGQEYWTGQLPFATEQKGLSEARLSDLLALGQEGYFAQQQAIPRGVPTPLELKPTTEEDPFLTEIKRKYGDKLGFMAEWLGKSPTERGYEKRRFAPRVSWRGF